MTPNKIEKRQKANLQNCSCSKNIQLLVISKGTRSCCSHVKLRSTHPHLIQCIRNSANECSWFTRGLITESQLLIFGCLQACNLCYKFIPPRKKKKQGEGRMRQEDGTNTSSCNRLIGPLWATSRYKIKTNRASHCALSGLNLPWVYQLVPCLLPSSPFLKDLIMDLSEGSQASFYLKRIRYFASKLETLLEVGNQYDLLMEFGCD